jgi:hypothetical protein
MTGLAPGLTDAVAMARRMADGGDLLACRTWLWDRFPLWAVVGRGGEWHGIRDGSQGTTVTAPTEPEAWLRVVAWEREQPALLDVTGGRS